MSYEVFTALNFEVVIFGVVTPRRLGGGYESWVEYIASGTTGVTIQKITVCIMTDVGTPHEFISVMISTHLQMSQVVHFKKSSNLKGILLTVYELAHNVTSCEI